MRDLDFAHDASPHRIGRWLPLAAAVVLLLACSARVALSAKALRDAQHEYQSAKTAARAVRGSRLPEPGTSGTRQEGIQLRSRTAASLHGLFSSIEAATSELGGNATLLSLQASTEGSARPILLAGVATSPKAAMDLVAALRDQPHLEGVRLLTQHQPESVGGGVRFQLSASVRPSLDRPVDVSR